MYLLPSDMVSGEREDGYSVGRSYERVSEPKVPSGVDFVCNSTCRHLSSLIGGYAARLVLNREGKRKRLVPSFPKVKPHAPNTIQTPARSELSFTGRLKQRIWTLGRKLGERDSKYAVKVGVACAVLSAGAFFDSTRPLFVRFWGDWALISVRPFYPLYRASPS